MDRPLGTDSVYINRSALQHSYSNAHIDLLTTSSCFMAIEVLITSAVVVEFMSTATSVGDIFEGFLAPSLLKHSSNRLGKPDYAATKEIH